MKRSIIDTIKHILYVYFSFGWHFLMRISETIPELNFPAFHPFPHHAVIVFWFLQMCVCDSITINRITNHPSNQIL